MTFEKSTPLAKSSREPVPGPTPDRGRRAFTKNWPHVLHADGTASVTYERGASNCPWAITVHRAPVIGLAEDHFTIDITPQTVCTWERLPAGLDGMIAEHLEKYPVATEHLRKSETAA